MTIEKVIVDSNFTLEEILDHRQQLPAPSDILDRQEIVTVTYYSFDGNLHRGQVVVDRDLSSDTKSAFNFIKKIKFPIKSVIPFVDRSYMSEDEKRASSNNSSGFNYRNIANTNTLSNHALGRAIDINPFINPFIKGSTIIPDGASYDKDLPGTITSDGMLVAYFKKMGWIWGGDWTDLKDYMHFEKSA